MEYESTAASEEKISGVHLNKLGAYSNRKLTEKSSQPGKPSNPEKYAIDVVWELHSDTWSNAKLSMQNVKTARR